MTSKTDVTSIRLPEELLTKIDEMVEKIGFFNSRAEYIVGSMEAYYRVLVSSRLKIDKQVEQLKGLQEIDPNTILSITTAAVNKYIEKYCQYGGKKKQVLLRAPIKLLESVDEYQPYIGLYKDRSEFIRCAVSNQIETDETLIDSMQRVRDHKVLQTRSTEDIVNSVLKSLQDSDSNQLDGLVNFANLLIKESIKPKNP